MILLFLPFAERLWFGVINWCMWMPLGKNIKGNMIKAGALSAESSFSVLTEWLWNIPRFAEGPESGLYRVLWAKTQKGSVHCYLLLFIPKPTPFSLYLVCLSCNSERRVRLWKVGASEADAPWSLEEWRTNLSDKGSEKFLATDQSLSMQESLVFSSEPRERERKDYTHIFFINAS